jgi:hypothetical protein
VARTGAEDRRALRRIVTLQSALLAVMLTCGILLRAAHPSANEAGRAAAAAAAPLSAEGAGFLKVVVRPWAHVYVNGTKVATTPVARRLALPPGEHFVRFENPYFRPEERTVVVEKGRTVALDVDLVRVTREGGAR